MPLIRVAAVVLLDQSERVLTVRKRGTERFMLPGGKSEAGEFFRQTARREVHEELGLELLEDDLEPLAYFRSAAANEPGHELESHVFRYVPPLTQTPQVAAEIEELRWLTEAELRDPPAELPLAPMLQFDAAPAIFGWREGVDDALRASLRAAYMTMHERARASTPRDGDRALSVAQYEDARRAYRTERGDSSRPGVATWPPTSQTLMKQLGDGVWAKAMESMNLTTAAGRARGTSTVGASKYVETVAAFLTAVADDHCPDVTSNSFAQFTAWLAQEKAAGRARPSAAGVRRHFGSWEAAKQAAEPTPNH